MGSIASCPVISLACLPDSPALVHPLPSNLSSLPFFSSPASTCSLCRLPPGRQPLWGHPRLSRGGLHRSPTPQGPPPHAPSTPHPHGRHGALLLMVFVCLNITHDIITYIKYMYMHMYKIYTYISPCIGYIAAPPPVGPPSFPPSTPHPHGRHGALLLIVIVC